MQYLSRLLLAVVWLFLQVQAAPRGSPRRRLGSKNKTEIPTAAPTTLRDDIGGTETGAPTNPPVEVEWDVTEPPTSLVFEAQWGIPTPTAHDKNTPWIKFNNDDDNDDDDEADDDEAMFTAAPMTPSFTEAPTRSKNKPSGGKNDAKVNDDNDIPAPAPVMLDIPFPTQATEAPVVTTAGQQTFTIMPTIRLTETPSTTPTITPMVLPEFSPVVLPALSPLGFQPVSSPSAPFPAVDLSPIDFDLLGRIPTFQFALPPGASASPTVMATETPSERPTAVPTTTATAAEVIDTLASPSAFWTPLKTFDIRLSRDTKWNTQFASDELQQALELYLTESFMLLSAELENVTLSLFTSAHSDDSSEAWYRFQGKLFYHPKSEGSEINPDEVWTQQVVLLQNLDAIQWILQNQPTLAAGFVTVEALTFLDGSTTQTFEGYTGGGSSSGLSQTTRIVIAVAAILLVLACSVGVYIVMFLDAQEPVPLIQTKNTSNTGSDMSVGKEPHSDVPEVSFEHDSNSAVSSITDLKGDETKQIGPESLSSSVDATDSNQETVQQSNVDRKEVESVSHTEWSIMAGNVDPEVAPPTSNNIVNTTRTTTEKSLLEKEDDGSEEEEDPLAEVDRSVMENESVDDLYLTRDEENVRK